MSSHKKLLSEKTFVIVVLLIIAISVWTIVKAVKDPGSDGMIPPTSTPSAIFDSVIREGSFCFFENSKNWESKSFIPNSKIVGTIGKNITGEWILVRWENFADCWVLLKFLDIQDHRADELPVIDKPFPPSDAVLQLTEEPAQLTEEPAQLTEEPAQPTEEPAQPTEEPAQPIEEPTFEVDVDTNTIECACGKSSGKAKITLNFKGGQPSYIVNGQTPVKGDNTSFETILGVKIHLKVISADGQVWEDDVNIPYCSDNQCITSGLTDRCTNKVVNHCTDIITTEIVCVKSPPGNPGNCLEEKKQEKKTTVCTTEIVCE